MDTLFEISAVVTAVDNFIILCNLHHKLILFVIVKGKGGCYIFMFS